MGRNRTLKMTLQEILESDRESLLRRIEAAPDLPAAADAAAEEFGRILVIFNEEEESGRVRASALEMLMAAKAGAAMTDSAGEPQIYERAAYNEMTERQRRAARGPGFGICLGAGLGCGLAEVLTGSLSAAKGVLLAGLPVHLILTGVAIVFTYLAGTLAISEGGTYPGTAQEGAAGRSRRRGLIGRLVPGSRRRSATDQGVLHASLTDQTVSAQVVPDPEKIYRHMQHAVMLMDHTLDEVRNEERLEVKRRLENGGAAQDTSQNAPDQDGIELMAQLLESAYADRESPSAAQTIADIRFYLHTKEIEVADYRQDIADAFDRMPAARTETIRPALLTGGRILKQGLIGIAPGQSI